MKLKDLSDKELDAIQAWIENEDILPVFWETSSIQLIDNKGDIDATIDEIRSDAMFQAVCKLEGVNQEAYLEDIRKNLIDHEDN